MGKRQWWCTRESRNWGRASRGSGSSIWTAYQQVDSLLSYKFGSACSRLSGTPHREQAGARNSYYR